MKMKTFRCRICGETYLGYDKPSQCPYCGAHASFLVPGADWKDEFDVDGLTEISKANLKQTLGFEVSNAAFYLSASANAKSKNLELEGMFKRLSKIEAEHASTVKKFLKLDTVPVVTEEASESILVNLKAAAEREQRAMDHYRQFAQEAVEPRLKEFWTELVAIEGDHFSIDTEEQSNFS